MTLPSLILAWQGAEDDALYFITSPMGAQDAPSFPHGQSKVGGAAEFGTSTRPAIVRMVSGKNPCISLAWKGVGNDTSMYAALWVGDPAGAPSADWRDPYNVPGGTTWGPAFTAWNNALFVAWKGAGTDTGIWASFCDDTLAPGSVKQFVTGIRSALSPAITTFGNQMIMVWRGEANDDALYWAISSDGTGWTHMGPIAEAASTDIPSLTVFNGQVWLAFKGLDTNIYMTNIVDVGDLPAHKARWQPRWQVPGIGTSHGPSLCAFGDQLFMAWKGSGDTNIWYSQSKTGAAKGWSTGGVLQKTIPGVGTSFGPAAFTFNG